MQKTFTANFVVFEIFNSDIETLQILKYKIKRKVRTVPQNRFTSLVRNCLTTVGIILLPKSFTNCLFRKNYLILSLPLLVLL